ncbi:MAG: hypothetical protein OQJ97_17145 [Rhodospirillales bacterium]|nr:hypothetical protein [Rhodospirillales bacterium]
MFRVFLDLTAIVASFVAILTYLNITPNALDSLPERFTEEANTAVKSIDLTIKGEEYFKTGNEAYIMYRAAIAMPNSYSKDKGLVRSVDKSLESQDFKLALSAAKEIESSYSMDKSLSKISNAALQEKSSVGYAIIAAEFADGSYTKSSILEAVVSTMETGKPPPAKKTNKIEFEDPEDISKLSNLERYKIIYRFADNSSYMDMSESEAKQFADEWTKNRTFEEFIIFRKVYRFADNSSYMGMTEKKAKEFALEWIENGYTADDYAVFSDAFKFADNGSFMDMSEDRAAEFAFQKLKEHKIISQAESK